MIRFENTKNINLNSKQIINWLNSVVNEEEKKIGDVIYVFCDDNFLLEKNKKYLNHDTLTDVITFDYSDKKTISGDILISFEQVEENAKIFNVKISAELKRVILHGLLHLLGYKDKTKKETTIMREKENYYLSKLQLL